MNVQLRPVTPADTDAIARIVKAAFDSIAQKHNFPPDFPSDGAAAGLAGLFVNHPSIWGVAAEVDGRVVGSNFLDQRNPIAGVGPITVDPAFHGRGIGRRLMNAVIEHGRAAGAPGIRLGQDAFNTTSFSLYASLGFDVKEPLALVTGKPRSRPAAAGAATVRPMGEDDVPACAELCRRVHGYDRAGELRDAIKMFRPFVLVRDDGRVVAYASAPTFWALNHGVAETEEDLRMLLIGAGAAADEPLAMLIPTRRTELFRWCLSEGLRMVKPITLMAMGDYREPVGAYFPSILY
jgi:predicted N-acetyltransferase YhbS